jgi:hypothetical protein
MNDVCLSTKNCKAFVKGKEKEWSEETKQASEPHSDMVQILELLDWKPKIIMISMLRALVKKVVQARTDG